MEHRHFKTLIRFSGYWKANWSGRCDIQVAVPVAAASTDPLAILPWLECEGVIVERYPWLTYQSHLNGEFSMWELPEAYRRTYVLALYAAYRRHAAQVVRGMWARSFEIDELFAAIRTDLHRLSAAIPEAPVVPSLDACPF